MLTEAQRTKYLKSFSEIENSFWLSDRDPRGDPIYEEAKAKVLSGDFTIEQALEFVIEQTEAEVACRHALAPRA